jgi:hypothetical protein
MRWYASASRQQGARHDHRPCCRTTLGGERRRGAWKHIMTTPAPQCRAVRRSKSAAGSRRFPIPLRAEANCLIVTGNCFLVPGDDRYWRPLPAQRVAVVSEHCFQEVVSKPVNEGRFGIGAAQTTQPPKTLQECCAFR